MRTVEKKIERQVQFWSLLGPFFLLLTLFVALVKLSPTSPYLAFIALAAVPLCWRWKIYGIGLVIGAIAGVVAYSFGGDSPLDRFWNMGMGIALSIGCIVTTLSFEEVEHLIQGLQVESASRLDNLWHLDEKIKKVQTSYESEKSALLAKLDEASSNLNALYKKLQDRELSDARLKEKFLAVEHEKEMLLEQVHQMRRQSDALERDHKEQKRNYQTVSGRAEAFENQVQQLLCQQGKAQERIQQLSHEVISKEQICDSIKKELYEQRQQAAGLQERLQETHTQAMAADGGVHPQCMERRLRQTEGKYRQLTAQFQQKSAILDQTRKELFQAQEALAALQLDIENKEFELAKEHQSEIKTLMDCFEEELREQAAFHSDEVQELSDIISSLLKGE